VWVSNSSYYRANILVITRSQEGYDLSQDVHVVGFLEHGQEELVIAIEMVCDRAVLAL
jgi:hypothetical protein